MFNAAKSQGKSKIEENMENSEDKNKSVVDILDESCNNLSFSCKLCLNNNVNSSAAKYCTNCNLLSCENCQTNCFYCSVTLCVNCVNIFGCHDKNHLSICEDCKCLLD
jgi:hypothetical protein